MPQVHIAESREVQFVPSTEINGIHLDFDIAEVDFGVPPGEVLQK